MNEPAAEPARFSDGAAERILEAAWDAPQTIEELAAVLEVEPTEAFHDWLESLVYVGRLVRIKGRKFQSTRDNTAVGLYRRARGYGKSGGFLAPEKAALEKIDIPAGMEESAQDGDRVVVSYRDQTGRRGRGGGLTGKVLGIIDARPTEAVGVLEFTDNGQPRVRLEGYNLPRYAQLEAHDLRRMKPGMVVQVKLARKPDANGRTRATLMGTVGNIDDPLHDFDNLVALFGFPGEFSDEAMAQARALPQHPSKEDTRGRVDLRELPIITIDPIDAQDHDDAFSLEELDGGLLRLGVHIADVAHYVTPDSALDADARFRATSVYLPGKVIPMLPKELSAGLCSLHDSVDRLAKSVFMVFDQSGNMLRREIVDSVVRVRRFLAYEQALPALQGGTCGDSLIDSLLVKSRALADQLLAKRLARGALILDIPRPHVYVNKAGLAYKVEPESHDIAHNLIEEFMLIANETVADFLIERGLPYIGRIHPAPSEDSVDDFWEYCDEVKLPQPDFDAPGELQKFLNDVKKRPGFDAIHYALLRSMTRAVYHAGPELHYALALRHYVHFTSPIRRYPDTLTHQVLAAYLVTQRKLRFETRALGLPWADGSTGAATKRGPADGRKIDNYEHWEFSLPHIAAHCTERSIRADQGSLAADQIKILRMMRTRIGEEMLGTVIGVSGRGVTVRLDENLAEGYVEFNALSDGWAETHRFWVIIETPTGVQKIVLGDRMEVEITDIDLASRSMRLTPLGKWARARGRSHGGRGRQDYRPARGARGGARGGDNHGGGNRNKGRKGKRRR